MDPVPEHEPGDDAVYGPVAAFAAALVTHGVTDVVISPGSRSTPLALTFHAQPELRTHVLLDERSAGFYALGHARITGRPAVLVCTSGTAAANYLPAVIEAHHAAVPLMVCTADRPPELRDWGAGQTIDQVGIYGTATRWAADLPVGGEWSSQAAAATAHRAVVEATGRRPGPVHLNWPFRKPLEPVGAVPVVEASPVRTEPQDRWSSEAPSIADLGDIAEVERGVIVVGPHEGWGERREHAIADAVRALSARTGWPVVADPGTQLRTRPIDDASLVVSHADVLLRDEELAAELAPEVMIRVGRTPTSASVQRWIERHPAPRLVLMDPTHSWHDPSHTVIDHVDALPEPALVALTPPDAAGADTEWNARWRAVDAAAMAAAGPIDHPLLTSADVVRVVRGAMTPGAVLMVSNSMPIRDVDSRMAAYREPVGDRITVMANRGAAGIDGITSTALGAAAAVDGRPVALLTGDVALLHDLGALAAARRLGLHLTVVCIDNRGGTIFSMLPAAGIVDDDDFATLFTTDPGVDLATLDGFAGVRAGAVDDAASLRVALDVAIDSTAPGVDLVVVRIDPDEDHAARRRFAAAVAESVRS